MHKSGAETIAGTKTFSSQIKGNISGTSSNVVVGSDTATARGYLVDSKLPWYTWEEGSQLIAGRVPLITNFNNLTKPGVYHVVFCCNDGYVHEEKEYKESLNRPSIPNITTGFGDGILEIKQTTTMYNISSFDRFTQKITLLSSNSNHGFNGRTYQRICINSSNNDWTTWQRVARDGEVVHTTGSETINGLKTFSYWTNLLSGLSVSWITGNKEQKALYLFGCVDDKYRGFGSELQLHGDDAEYGKFFLIAKDKTNTNVKHFVGSPDGTLTWDGKNILTDANQIMLAKNLTGTKVAPGGVVDCGNGNGNLKQWYIDANGTLHLAANLLPGVWKNASFIAISPNECGIFIKIG